MRKERLCPPVKNERLESIVERCLESPAAYQLFGMLACIAELDLEAKTEYLQRVRDSGAYTEQEIGAIERLIVSGAAQYFKGLIDQARQVRIEGEIDQLLAS